MIGKVALIEGGDDIKWPFTWERGELKLTGCVEIVNGVAGISIPTAEHYEGLKKELMMRIGSSARAEGTLTNSGDVEYQIVKGDTK